MGLKFHQIIKDVVKDKWFHSESTDTYFKVIDFPDQVLFVVVTDTGRLDYIENYDIYYIEEDYLGAIEVTNKRMINSLETVTAKSLLLNQ